MSAEGLDRIVLAVAGHLVRRRADLLDQIGKELGAVLHRGEAQVRESVEVFSKTNVSRKSRTARSIANDLIEGVHPPEKVAANPSDA